MLIGRAFGFIDCFFTYFHVIPVLQYRDHMKLDNVVVVRDGRICAVSRWRWPVGRSIARSFQHYITIL